MKIKHILWWVAGAERELMEQCPTDNRKQGAIGWMIMVTALIAACSGTAAAWFFTQHSDKLSDPLSIGHILFGLVWAVLIFSVDRCLVVTLKKDPTKSKTRRAIGSIIPLLTRAALAALIAFIISIPVELLLFRGLISEERPRYEEETAIDFGKATRESDENIRLTKEIADDSISYDKYANQINKIKTQLDNHKSERDKLKLELGKPKGSLGEEYHRILRDIEILEGYSELNNNQQTELSRKKTRRGRIIAEWNAPRNEKISVLNTTIQKEEEEKAEWEAKADSVENVISIIKGKIRVNNDTIGIKQDGYTNLQKQASQFVRQFEILMYAVSDKDDAGNLRHPWDGIFIWLIRCFFFIIELLPTLVKIVMPIGVYDSLLYEKEQELKAYFNSDEFHNIMRQREVVSIQHKLDLEKDQNDIDKTTRHDILRLMSDAQIEVADAYSKKWKQEALDKLNIAPPQNVGIVNSVTEPHPIKDNPIQDDFD